VISPRVAVFEAGKIDLPTRDSISEMRRLVRGQDKLLREIAANTHHLRDAGVDAPASILDMDEANESIFSQLINAKDDKDTGFETVILNSQVYSNAFTNVLESTSNDDQSNGTRTVSERTQDTSVLAIDALQIKSSISSLHVSGIQAYTRLNYAACSNEELTFKKGLYIGNIQRLTNSRWRGKTFPASIFWPSRSGLFNRDQVDIIFTLDQPLKVRTSTACSKPLLTYEEGEILLIEVR
jgi:hypothetical protein